LGSAGTNRAPNRQAADATLNHTLRLTFRAASYGHIEAMAYAMAAGAAEAGANVDVMRVPETAPEAVARGAGFKIDQKAPVAKVTDLEGYALVRALHQSSQQIERTGAQRDRRAVARQQAFAHGQGEWAEGGHFPGLRTGPCHRASFRIAPRPHHDIPNLPAAKGVPENLPAAKGVPEGPYVSLPNHFITAG
jgi:hypothetical protein